MFFKQLKNIIFSKTNFKFTEEEARAYQAAHAERLEQTIKDLPPEFVGFNQRLKILNDNSWAVHHLFKRAFDAQKYAEAFLYFFYAFELNLKHLIMTEMMLINMLKFLEERKTTFSVYSSEEINIIQDWDGTVGTLINKFCSVCGNKLESDLRKINKERNFIIHNMMKKQLTETQISNSFKDFFEKTKAARTQFYISFDAMLADRPNRIISKIAELTKPI